MAYEGYYRGLQSAGKVFKNGDIIPILGFGTGTGYFERPEAVREGIVLAFKTGYRLIDTAQVNTISLEIKKSVINLVLILLSLPLNI